MPQFGQQLDIDSAYRLQTRALKILLAGKRPDGFKAGLTSTAAQEKFSFRQPVAGVLLAGSQLAADEQGTYSIRASAYPKLMMEIEIGFQLDAAISVAVADVNTLKTLVRTIYPVIELPDLGFEDMASLVGTDIIANNVAARKYIVGQNPQVPPANLNAMQIDLYRDGQLILQGKGSDALGDQWQALLWLVNRSLANGWILQPGQILITGALGKMLPAARGQYSAHYEGVGQINWRVE